MDQITIYYFAISFILLIVGVLIVGFIHGREDHVFAALVLAGCWPIAIIALIIYLVIIVPIYLIYKLGWWIRIKIERE